MSFEAKRCGGCHRPIGSGRAKVSADGIEICLCEQCEQEVRAFARGTLSAEDGELALATA